MSLVKSLYESFKGIPSVFIDGMLCVVVSFFAGWSIVFGGEDAAKYVNEVTLWWLKSTTMVLVGTLNALIFFRSKSYSDHLTKKANESNTSFITKS